jgi:hypothetical protein
LARGSVSGKSDDSTKSFSEQIQENKERNAPSWLKNWNANNHPENLVPLPEMKFDGDIDPTDSREMASTVNDKVKSVMGANRANSPLIADRAQYAAVDSFEPELDILENGATKNFSRLLIDPKIVGLDLNKQLKINSALDMHATALNSKLDELTQWDDSAKSKFYNAFATTDEPARQIILDRIQKQINLNASINSQDTHLKK